MKIKLAVLIMNHKYTIVGILVIIAIYMLFANFFSVPAPYLSCDTGYGERRLLELNLTAKIKTNDEALFYMNKIINEADPLILDSEIVNGINNSKREDFILLSISISSSSYRNAGRVIDAWVFDDEVAIDENGTFYIKRGGCI